MTIDARGAKLLPIKGLSNRRSMRKPMSRIGMQDIVLKCVDAFVGVQDADCVDPSVLEQPVKSGARFRPEQRVIDSTLRFVDIQVCEYDA